MYTIILDEGIVQRNSDLLIVSPCEDPNDSEFIKYINWINEGNEPLVLNTRSEILS